MSQHLSRVTGVDGQINVKVLVQHMLFRCTFYNRLQIALDKSLRAGEVLVLACQKVSIFTPRLSVNLIIEGAWG